MEEPQIVLVAGGRDMDDGGLVFSVLQKLEIGEIVQGGAKGADNFGKQYAKSINCINTEFKADWNTHGKSAGPIRNSDMAYYLVSQRDKGLSVRAEVFWDGNSRGTKNMITNLFKAKINTNITFYGRNEEK